MPELTYASEDIGILPELLPLAQAHAHEITYEITRDDPLDLDADTYRTLYEIGALKIFTARCDGALVGYLGFVISNSLERRYLKQAHECGLFLAPEHRHGRAALRLMDLAERVLRSEGCDIVLYHSPIANPKFGALLAHRGYAKVDEVYARRFSCQVQ